MIDTIVIDTGTELVLDLIAPPVETTVELIANPITQLIEVAQGMPGPPGPPGSGAAWGQITGSIQDQDDLQAELDAIDANIAALGSDLDTESLTRQTFDNALQADITAEAAARASADTTLQTNINAKVTANGAITGATKAKITYDSNGLVTAGADLAAADIPALATSQIIGLDAALAARELTANKNAANGYAPLDASAMIPVANSRGEIDRLMALLNTLSAGLGDNILMQSWGVDAGQATTAINFSNNTMTFGMFAVYKAQAVTGLNFFMRTVGNYTASNRYSGISLYKHDFATGMADLVAYTTHNGDWVNTGTKASNTWYKIPFDVTVTTLTLQPGIYYICYSASWSASTTTAQFAGSASLASNGSGQMWLSGIKYTFTAVSPAAGVLVPFSQVNVAAAGLGLTRAHFTLY